MTQGLYWLPRPPADWRRQALSLAGLGESVWTAAIRLAKYDLSFLQTNGLDEIVRQTLGERPPGQLDTKPVRLAILGSSTLAHLHAGIRVGGMRRGLHISTYENAYGQYRQELSDPGSQLHAFRPTAVLFSFDARHVTEALHAALSDEEAKSAVEHQLDLMRQCWEAARSSFGCAVYQQTILPVLPNLLGSNEHRLAGSRNGAITRLNAALRELARVAGVDLVSLDDRVARDGLAAWHDVALWHRTKQEVKPPASPLYGDLVARVLAAKQGLSAKCLVLDLDNTLWGGVIGDDGLGGIVLGQGSGVGEAFVAIQAHARELARRGVILAVCSKNDPANAVEPFDLHPEMALRRADIACFQASWDDKAANIHAIAEALNIGLDALVFLDDNPFERNRVREALPMVAVPEFPDEPADVPQMLADAGYFEGLAVTEDDRQRTRQYRGNVARQALEASSADLDSYLRRLEMQLVWRRFDAVGLQRTVQLINKTNQFNLTTRRYTEADVQRIMHDPDSFGLQLRLIDRFGDNGIISIIIGGSRGGGTVVIDTWLMSCRVLGRQVERTTLNLVVEQARRLGAQTLIGEYLPTKKNAMVKDHYRNLGFTVIGEGADGSSRATLALADYTPQPTFIEVIQDDR